MYFGFNFSSARGCPLARGAMRWRACVIALGWAIAGVLACAPVPARAQADAADAQTREAKGKLEAVRAEVRALQDSQLKAQAERGALVLEVRRAELQIADTLKSLRAIEARIAIQTQGLQSLDVEREALERKLESQREVLASLLRSAYAVGRHEKLQVLFARDKIADTERLLAYHRYLERDRSARIGAIARDQHALNQVRASLEAARAALQREASAKQTQNDSLSQGRLARERAIAALDAAVADRAATLKQRQTQERELVALLARLQNAIADVPVKLAGDEPLSHRRGRLPWPARGPLKAGFGVRLQDGRVSDGWWIGAASGSGVHAIARGRVAYADWLNGFGLMVILDHGDGFMSLYARVESIVSDVGTWVEAGDVLATAAGGQTQGGLYFELRRNGQPVNPAQWLSR